MANSEINKYDRISTLPDDVLCHILSFLHTKYAAQTSVLSTRWKHLFTLVPVLDFGILPSTQAAQDTNTKSFINFVYKVLRRVPNLRIFKHYLSPKTKAHFYSWISAALLCNVSQVSLDNSLIDYSLELPYDLCTSKTLVQLNLSGEFSLNSVDSMCLPSLKILHLEPGYYCVNQLPHDLLTSHTLVELKLSGTFSLVLVDSMCCLPSLKTLHLSGSVACVGKSKHLSFSTFPVLEDLCFDCTMDSDISIDITISSLKKLKLQLNYCVDNLVLDAPALEFLDFFCYSSIRVSGSKILDSLVKAHIFVDLPWKNGSVQRLIEMISSVHNLSLSWYSMKALTSLRDYELPMYQNLTRLELHSFDKAGWKLLPDLLESSPNLELLIFKSGLLNYREQIIKIDKILPRRECACLSHHLKELEVREFYGVELEFQFVESFLKNSKVLKKIVIHSTEPPETRHMICQRLLAFPRYSSDCQIVVLLNKSCLDQLNKYIALG